MSSTESLEETALSTINRYNMLAGGERVAVSVSGGPDSVALLLFLHGIAEEMRLDLHVFHLDHMIRGAESEEDARFTRELAEGLGLPSRLLAVDVRARTAGGGRSPQDAARRVRLEALRRFAVEISADRVATGHTADDQVETFLMRVVQGAGLAGLGGIPPVSGPFIRPLIGTWRAQVEEYCARKGVSPRVDSSNVDTSYLRNHVRASLVPFMTAEFGSSVKEVILREVESLAADREFVAEQAAQSFALTASERGDELRIDIPRLASLPNALQRAVVREAWARMMPGEPSLGWRHVMDVLEKLARGRTGASLDLPGDLKAEREYAEIVFRPAGGDTPVEPGGSADLDVPGTARAPGSTVVIEASMVDRRDVHLSEDPREEYVRPDVELPLEVRTPRPGDRFQPLGSPGTRKLKDFFIDIKLPRRQRRCCPVVLSGGRIVWVAGMRLDERFRLRPSDSRAVKLIMRAAGEYDFPVESLDFGEGD